MEAKTRGIYRSRTPRLWQTMLASFLLFGVAVLATSSLGQGKDDSPEALIKKARELVEQQKYEEAQAVYARIIKMKPPTPAVFLDAEKEINTARLKALEARRKAAQAQKEKENAQAQEQGTGQTSKLEDTRKTGGETTPATPPPDVNLPELPEIGGGL